MIATTSPWDLKHIGVLESDPAFQMKRHVNPSRGNKQWRDELRELEAKAQQIPFPPKTPRYLPPGLAVRRTIPAGIPFGEHPAQETNGQNKRSASTTPIVPPSRLMFIGADDNETSEARKISIAFEMSQHQGLFARVRVAKGSAGRVHIGKDIPAIAIEGVWNEEGGIVRWIAPARNQLLWEDETFVYSLSSNLPLEELKKVAASV